MDHYDTLDSYTKFRAFSPGLHIVETSRLTRCDKRTFFLDFAQLVNFGASGDTFGQTSPILEFVYSKAGLSLFPISSRSDNLSTRYLQQNFVDIVDSVTETKKKQ